MLGAISFSGMRNVSCKITPKVNHPLRFRHILSSKIQSKFQLPKIFTSFINTYARLPSKNYLSVVSQQLKEDPKKLTIKYIGIHSLHVPVLIREINKYTQELEAITLNGNGLKPGSLSPLLDSLHNHKNIKRINIGMNEMIGLAGLNSLVRLIKNLPDLTELFCAHNGITDEGVTELVHAMKNLPKMKILHLSYNKIQAEGAARLLQAASVHPNLEELNLRGNQIEKLPSFNHWSNVLFKRLVLAENPIRINLPTFPSKINIEL